MRRHAAGEGAEGRWVCYSTDTRSGIVFDVHGTASALIRLARRRAGLSQRELARRAGTSQAAVQRYERGLTDPTFSTLERVIGACELELRIQLAPVDDHDRQLVGRVLDMDPETRLRTNWDHAALVRHAHPA